MCGMQGSRVQLAQGQRPQNCRIGNAAWYLPGIPEASRDTAHRYMCETHTLPLSNGANSATRPACAGTQLAHTEQPFLHI